jgi:hypothetical protein
MGEVYDPWEKESLVMLPEQLLISDWPHLVPALRKLNDSGFRIPVGQADAIYCRYLKERGKPWSHWIELDAILTTIALARHPKALEEVEEVFALGEFDFTGVASRALLAWHGMPELFLIWVDSVDSTNFDELPLPVQDYIRGVDLINTWEGSGISCYFEDAPPEKIKHLIEAFRRMNMPTPAAALTEALEWWSKVQAVHDLKLKEETHYAAFEPVHAKWEGAAWKMNDHKNSLLEGISRHAVKHALELRRATGWFEISAVN